MMRTGAVDPGGGQPCCASTAYMYVEISPEMDPALALMVVLGHMSGIGQVQDGGGGGG